MDEYRLYPKEFRNFAGMLSSRTTKTCKPVGWILVVPPAKARPQHLHMFPGGVSSRLGQGADGPAHGFVCDFDESTHKVNELRQTIFKPGVLTHMLPRPG